MSRSFDHRVYFSDRPTYYACSAARCVTDSRYLFLYSYRTRRGGRRTTNRRYYCPAHAARRARTLLLELPPLGTPTAREA